MGTQLLTTLDGSVRTGAWLDAVTERHPAVLGWESARRLGIPHVGEQVWIGDRWFDRSQKVVVMIERVRCSGPAHRPRITRCPRTGLPRDIPGVPAGVRLDRGTGEARGGRTTGVV